MLRRSITFILLFTMVLHSASRLGVLSYLYKQRHEIAYAIGLIAEVPIAMCNSDYHASNNLTFVSHDDEAGTIPPAIVSAKEIQLFFVSAYDHLNASRSTSIISHESEVIEKRYSPPVLSIFNPPS